MCPFSSVNHPCTDVYILVWASGTKSHDWNLLFLSHNFISTSSFLLCFCSKISASGWHGGKTVFDLQVLSYIDLPRVLLSWDLCVVPTWRWCSASQAIQPSAQFRFGIFPHCHFYCHCLTRRSDPVLISGCSLTVPAFHPFSLFPVPTEVQSFFQNCF